MIWHQVIFKSLWKKYLRTWKLSLPPMDLYKSMGSASAQTNLQNLIEIVLGGLVNEVEFV